VRPFVKRFALCCETVVLFVCPVCLSVCTLWRCILWPNGWMDQDEAWHGGRPRPRPYCVKRWPISPKGAQPPIFGPCLLWPNGWMDQDATWYGGRPLPWPHCVRWGPSPPQRGTASNFRPMSCGQWAEWIKMPLGTEDGSRPRPRPHCVWWGPSSFRPLKGVQQPPLFGPYLLWPNGCPSLLLLSACTIHVCIFAYVHVLHFWSVQVDFTIKVSLSEQMIVCCRYTSE